MGREQPNIHPLFGMIAQSTGMDTQGAPDHWLRKDMQLRNNTRRVEVTIPKHFTDHADIDRDEPPEVTAYYDPHTGLAIFDLQGYFNEVTY